MPEGNADEPVTLLSSDDDEAALPNGLANGGASGVPSLSVVPWPFLCPANQQWKRAVGLHQGVSSCMIG